MRYKNFISFPFVFSISIILIIIFIMSKENGISFITCFSLFTVFCFFSLLLKEIYDWNNGISRKSKLPWIKTNSYNGYSFCSCEEIVHFEWFNPIEYNHENAIFKTKHNNLINNIKAFN